MLVIWELPGGEEKSAYGRTQYCANYRWEQISGINNTEENI